MSISAQKGYGDGGKTAYFFFHIVYIKLNFQKRKYRDN